MARQATIRIDAETQSARAELEQLGGSLDEVEAEAVDASGGFERLSVEASEELAETRSQAARTAASMNQLSGNASSTASQLGTDLVQASQDAAFGIENLAGSAPFLNEQFQRLRSQTGSTTGALSELLETFLGPTGVLALGTLGLQALPALREFFSGVGESAEEASEQVDQLKSATETLIEGFAEDLPSFEITDRAQARQLQQGLEQSIQAREQVLEDLREALGATGAEQARLSRGAARFAELSDAAIQDLISRQQTQLRQEQALEQVLSEKLRQREQAVQQQDLLNSAMGRGIQLAQDQTGEQRKQSQLLSDQLRSIGRIQQVQAAEVQQIQVQTRPQLVGSSRELGRMNDQLQDTQRQSESAFDAVRLGAQAATSATNALTQSLARGESFARGLQQTFSQLLAQVGSSLLAKAIEGGSAFGLSGGPLAAIGIGGGLLGGLFGSFQSGGIADTPFQIVGERGPELAALPTGSRVFDASQTAQILSQAARPPAGGRTINIVTEIRRLRNGDLGLAVDEAQERAELYTRRNG